MMKDLLEKAVERMRDDGAEFCDARTQTIDRTAIIIVDGGVRTLSDDHMAGMSFRAKVKGSWGYATLVEGNQQAILDAASKAVHNAQAGGAEGKTIPERKPTTGTFKAKVKIHPSSVPLAEKISAVRDAERAQRVDGKVVNSNGLYREEVRHNTLVNSLGDNLDWEEVRTRLFGQAVSSDGTNTEMFYDILDGSMGWEVVKDADLVSFGQKVGREAVKMLQAKKAPSGLVTCISDPYISGLLAHEVMGHASEADEIVKQRSFLSKVVGKKVASEQITMIDDGTVERAHGYIPFDDEGTPSSRTVIIKDGIYQGYMQSLETAAIMGTKPTGNGRAQDFGRRVWVRMTNTFFDKGDQKLEEMIEDVKFGVLTEKMVSGMEDPVGGGFEAKSLRGFLIENGKVTDMLRSFTLTGSALQILQTVDAVGKDVGLDGGMCGKGIEDYVPVSSGGPYCRSKIVLGGG
ncbi:MAG: protease TldD [Methanomassiliicoccales archaeon PtaU1.Bin124]|nr:MAG: protease TldD [Methanomassiliicoccales archaeon PtaU1.Bin124]